MKLLLENIRLPLADFDLALDGEFDVRLMVVLGPSGAGKTSLLEVIAGIRRPKQGRIVLDEEVVFDASRRVWSPPHHRRVGYVPQDLALFPHMSVQANLRYGLRAPTPDNKLETICKILEIGPFLHRMPHSLSGGQKQRVAFARAVLAAPKLLLLDEPLSSLDQSLKERIFPYLRRMRDDLEMPMLFVTHSIHEAQLLGDSLLMMDQGHITAQGVPEELLAYFPPKRDKI